MTRDSADAAPRRRSSPRRAAPWRAVLAWLRAVPVDDPVDRRNAPMLQALLLLIGLALPLLALLRWQRETALGIDLTRELLVVFGTAFAWTCFYLVRVGYFRRAAGLLIGSNLVLLAVAYADAGLRLQMDAQVVHLVPLVLGGLLLGRRWLWLIAAALFGVFVLGATRDLLHTIGIPALRDVAIGALLRATFGLLLLALILDRAVSALRDALDTANRRGDELARTRDRLEHEIVERERSQAQLLHAQKMEAVGRLAGGVAHDFNNLLGVIVGYASRADAAWDPAGADEALAGIRAAAKRGTIVTRRLLSLSRREARSVEVLDLRAVLHDTVPMLRQLLGDNVQLDARIDDTPLPLRADRAELELALLNIAANARDAMPDGGRFALDAARDADTITLRLRDDGMGMGEEVRARMFDPFFTTKPHGEGTGIGLAAVQRLVDDAGGHVAVASATGQGTTLTLVFPVAPPSAPPLPARDAPAHPHVLLVEDDRELREILAAALREAGCTVQVAARLREATHVARDAARIDAIVSDFDLPDGNADTLFAQLAPLWPQARLVLVSALDRTGQLQQSRGLAVRHLMKPFAPAQLVTLVRDASLAR